MYICLPVKFTEGGGKTWSLMDRDYGNTENRCGFMRNTVLLSMLFNRLDVTT